MVFGEVSEPGMISMLLLAIGIAFQDHRLHVVILLCPWPLCGETRGLPSLEAVDRECVNT